jgi:NAD(P)-dependent dehydrogenase (short-subunit alcohol dehydrogenase family)
MDLHGQRVVVLGGTSGVGLAVAAGAGSAGAEVVVVSSRRSSVDKALSALPDDAVGRVADLSDPATVRAVLEEMGELDHLVYTAGEPLALKSVIELDVEQARRFFDLRFFGALAAVSAAAPLVRPGGSITLTTGTAKDRPGAGWAVPASICGAVEALTKALAVELAPIRVNAVSPGVLRSPLWAGMGEAEREQMYWDIAEAIPVGRIGEIGDAAQAYLYCMTQTFTTGTVLTVDGGTVLV